MRKCGRSWKVSEKTLASAYMLHPSQFPNPLIYQRVEDDEGEKRGTVTLTKLWHYLKRRLEQYEKPPGGIQELWERIEVEWEKIDAAVCQNLIESMPRRVAAVIKAKGGYTKY